MGDRPPLTAPAWVLPTGCSPSGIDHSSLGPPWGHKPCQQTCSNMGSSLHGSAGGACSSVGPPRVTASIGHPPAPVWGPPRGCRWISAPLWTSMGCRTCLPHHGLLHGLQDNLCSGAQSTSSPSFFTDLGVCRVVSHIFFLLSPVTVAQILFPPFLNTLPQRRCHHH